MTEPEDIPPRSRLLRAGYWPWPLDLTGNTWSKGLRRYSTAEALEELDAEESSSREEGAA